MIAVWGFIIFLAIATLVIVATTVAVKNEVNGTVIRGNLIVIFICLAGAIVMLFNYLKGLHH